MHFRGSAHRGTQHAVILAVTALALLWSLAAGGQHPVAADDPALPSTASLPGVGTPVRLTIAAINVDAAIEAVGLTADGTVDTPQTPDDTAWYQLGPRPGEPGNAVIVGHVDSSAGGAVFWDLRTLTPGSMIVVVSDDGVTHQFVMR
ncbi:MAG: class F sortase, partial [Thermomicrobiales bacterium]